MSEIKAKIYSAKGETLEEIGLPESVFARPINQTLLSQVVVLMQKNLKVPTSHAKDRSEVRGGGRKPWRQKGTGRARHGSIRSPIWKGGGVTHGPQKGRNNTKKINKKVKNAGLAMSLSGKRADGEVFFVDTFLLESPKTKGFVLWMAGLLENKKGSVLLVTDTLETGLDRSTRNLKNVSVQRAANLTAYDVLSHRHVVISKRALDILTKRLS